MSGAGSGRRSPNSAVRKVHFEDFGGTEFERLVFAYHVRVGWSDLAWYGETGSDEGRDIVGTDNTDGVSRRTVIQCVNRGALTQQKAAQDMAKAVASPTGKPDAFRFVCRSTISGERRDAVRKAAERLGVAHVTVWSGAEFEENLRLRAEDLLRRFCDGEAFPDGAAEIRRFADDFSGLSDSDALTLMAAVFERPAFWTPFREESSLPGFLRAIDDTIAALNTGIWRTREGDEIRRIPSIHHLQDSRIRSAVTEAARRVDDVRRLFVKRLRDGGVKPCGCGKADCPVFFIRPTAATELDAARKRALDAFQSAHPAFRVMMR